MSAARRVVMVAVVVVVLKAGVRCEADIVPDGYQQDLRPTSKNGDPINVGISIKINSITEVNLEQMSILFEMYFRVAWKDPRLVFPQSYVNASSDDPEGSSTTQQKKTTISVLPKFLKKVWVPDLYIRGTRSIDTFFILQEFQGVTISSDLTVFTSIMMQLRLVCGMVFHTYPFDTQECTIYITSYGYTLNEMTFKWMPPGLGTDDLERHLAGYDFSVKSLNGTMCLCVKCVPQWSACLRVRLVLRRQSFIHIMSSYVPSGLFVVVGWTSFFWPAEVVPGRTVLVITSLLTITSMYTGIRQASPTTSYVKAIDVWMLTCILFTTMPLLQYALILSWRKTSEVSSVTKVVPDFPGMVSLQPGPDGLRVSGPMVNLMEIIVSSLNTCLVFLIPEDRLFGAQLLNGTWNGIIAKLQSQEVDISGVPLLISPKRRQIFDNGEWILMAFRSMVHARPAVEADILSFVRPFTMQTATCPIYFASETLLSEWNYIVYRKTFPLRHQVDVIIRRLRESGILESLLLEGQRDARHCLKGRPTDVPGNSLRALGFKDYYGVLLMYCGGMVVAAMILVMEVVLGGSRSTHDSPIAYPVVPALSVPCAAGPWVVLPTIPSGPG